VTETPQGIVAAVLPEETIRFTPRSDNEWSFRPEGIGTEGYVVLRRDVELGDLLYGGLWVRHSKKGVRLAGEILGEVADGLGGNATMGALSLLGTAVPWLAAAKLAIGGVGVIEKILASIPDRDLGFINLSERFGSEFEDATVLIRSQKTSSGDMTLNWRWAIHEEEAAPSTQDMRAVRPDSHGAGLPDE